jgi:hypothetical protein
VAETLAVEIEAPIMAGSGTTVYSPRFMCLHRGC